MARSVEVIEAAIIADKEADSVLAGLTSTSRTAVWRLWVKITARAMWVFETLFDSHKAEVTAIINTMKPHSLQWYCEKAKAYQHGVALPEGSDVYAVVPPVDESTLIVSNAAGVELGGLVRIKVAKVSGGALGALTVGELSGFRTYMNRIKDAGVRLQLTSGAADDLRLACEVAYDPLVLDSAGARLDGTAATPVKDAINTFLKALPFNGLFVINRLVEYVENNVEGVVIFTPVTVEARYGAIPYATVTVEYLPDAGYMVLDAAYFDAEVMYSGHGPI